MSKEVRKIGIEKGDLHSSNIKLIIWLTIGRLVHNIVQKIGFPISSPDLRNASGLQEYYMAVKISRTEYFNNLISVAEFSAHHEWSALGKPTDRDEWGMTVPTVNVSR